MEDQDKAKPEEIVKDEPVENESAGTKSVKDKKKVNKPAIFFGIVALILAGVSVFFGIEYFKPKEEPEPVTVEKIEKEVKVEVVKETMAEDYKEVEDVVKDLSAGIDGAYGISNSRGLTYKPEGLNTHIPMKLDIVKKIRTRNNEEAIYAALESNFKKSGFESVGILPHLGSAGPKIDGYFNTSRDIVCGIYEDSEPGYSGIENYVYLRCAKTDWVWLTEDEKKMVGELETAYRDKTGEYPTTLYNLENKIKDSQNTPYQTLEVEIGGGYALFYRTSPEGKWQYFAGGQSYLDCSDYNTEDLKKAFAGDVCYNGNQQSTVQL